MDINGEKVRRAYSLSSSPVIDDLLTVTVKRVEGGKMSNKINEIELGTVIEVMPPQGRFFTEINASNRKHYFLIGGGSGITPLISIIKTVLYAEPNSRCTLIYGNRNSASIIFKKELDDLVASYPERLNVVYSIDHPEPGWNGLTGMLTADTIKQLITQHQGPIAEKEYFICGPAGMMEQAKQALQSLNVNSSNIHIEYFTAPTGGENKPVEVTAPESDFEGSKVFVKLGGKQYELLIKDKTTILHAAIKAGIDPPFSCEAGICSTCMAKVIEGSVKMDENNILTDEEVKKGFVLTCQAHPTSKIVVLEYYD
jgi:ring-1,2-phenylacetyl-CoA epoxidase subunit PaaE